MFYCRAVMAGFQAIRLGDAQVVIAGGMESMSQAHHSACLRNGIRMGNASFVDTMVTDGLTDAFHNIHMGVTGNNRSNIEF
jgi:acetyl-CoA C-acetyltransferase